MTEIADHSKHTSAPSASRMFLATSAWNAIARGTFLLGGFLGTVLIARSLPSASYGLYAFLSVLISYVVVVCDLGLSSGLLRFATDIRENRQGFALLAPTFGSQLAIGIVVAGLAYTASPFLERFYRVELSPYIAASIVIALLSVLRLDLHNTRIAAGKGGTLVTANVTFAVIWVVGLLTLTRIGPRLTVVLALQAVAMATLCAGLLIGSAPVSRLDVRSISMSLPAGMLVYSLAFMTKGLVNQVVLKQSEVFFIGRYMSMHEVALYDVGYSFPFFALMSLNQAIYPVAISSLTRVAQEGIPSLRRAIKTFYKVLFIHVVPIAVLGIMYGDKLIELVYGPRLAAAGSLARIFFGVQALFFLTTGVVVGMYAVGKPWAGFQVSVLQAVVNVLLDFLLIPQYGLGGAIMAVLGTLVLTTPLFFRAYVTTLGRGLVPGWYLVRCCAAASLMVVLLPFRDHIAGPLSMMMVLAGAGVIYLLGVRMFGLIGGAETRLLQNSGLRLAKYAAVGLGNSRWDRKTT